MSSTPKVTSTVVSVDTQTDAGEPVLYLATPNAEVTGTLTVEFDDGHALEFGAGQGFIQARSAWHRGINRADVPLRFLAVFYGAAGVPNVLHPPLTA
jgi:hypothetical protein